MRKILLALSASISVFLGACSITQIMQDNVSFEGLTKFYVEIPEGGSKLVGIPGGAAEINATLVASISAYLEEHGYERVEKRSEAQIIFRPLWSMSVIPTQESTPIFMSETSPIGRVEESYATLEIQAILSDGDIWAWRGFSPIEMIARNATADTINEQVKWCLKYFPPEKYPSDLQLMREDKAEKENAEAENPYKEVLIEERAKQESEAKAAQ